MKVIAFNASPKMDRSTTSLILDPFLEGLREAGATAELFYTRKLNVKPCLGDRSCSTKTPGQCIQQDDDMHTLYPKLTGADLWVFATPVYWGGMTGPMKNVMDRMVPLLLPPSKVTASSRRKSTGRDGAKGQVVLVSNCGWWDRGIFDLLLAHMKAFSFGVGRDFAGALLRPHGPALGPMRDAGAGVDDVFQAATEAGRQLVRDGRMSQETLDVVARELLPRDTYMQAST